MPIARHCANAAMRADLAGQAGEASFGFGVGRGEDLQTVTGAWCQPGVGYLEVEFADDRVADRSDSGVFDLRDRVTVP